MKLGIMSTGKMLLWGCVLCGLLAVGDDAEENPLMYLNRGQRKHFEIYARINKTLSEKKELDLKQAFEDTYRPVRDWCEVTAPKFKFESMKAGDKAKTINNPRVRQEWIEKSALYWEMHETCLKLIKGYESGRKSAVLPEMRKLMSNEMKARKKRFPLPPREWLSQSEADNLLFRLTAPRRARNQAEKGRRASDQQIQQGGDEGDTEPRQGHVRNSRRQGRNQQGHGRQSQRRNSRQGQRRR